MKTVDNTSKEQYLNAKRKTTRVIISAKMWTRKEYIYRSYAGGLSGMWSLPDVKKMKIMIGSENFDDFFFCGMVDRQKAFGLISSRDHCQRS